MAATTFPQFALLPVEIQLMIFEEAALEHTRDRVVVCTEGWGPMHRSGIILLPTRTLLTPLMRTCTRARKAHRNMHPQVVRVQRYDLRHPRGLPRPGLSSAPVPAVTTPLAPVLDVYLSPARDVLWLASDTADPGVGAGTHFWGAARYHGPASTPEFCAAWRRVLVTCQFAGHGFEWTPRKWWRRKGFTGVQSAGARLEIGFQEPITSWDYPSRQRWSRSTASLWNIVDRDPGRNALVMLTNLHYAQIWGRKRLDSGSHPAHRWN